MTMRPTILLIFCILLTSLSSVGQDLFGYRNSNYAGVSGIDLNPASIADSRYKADVNLFGGSVSIYQNYYGMDTKALKKPFSDNSAFNDSDFFDKYVTRRDGDFDKSLNFNASLYLPSFMFTISEKDAVGFTSRIRSYTNIDGVGQDLIDLMEEGFDDSTFFDRRLNNGPLSVQSMSWIEYGASYGRVVLDQDKHFFKAGGRVKFIQGIQSAYFYSDAIEYEFAAKDSILIINTDISYGHSDNFNLADNYNPKFEFASKPTVGIDIGFVYEFRPDRDDYTYEKTKENFVDRRDQNKYKFRIGASLLDVGRVKFKKADGSQNIRADLDSFWDLDTLDVLENINDLDKIIADQFVFTEQGGESYTQSLPTALSLQFDYHIAKDFYVNFTPFWSFQRKNKESKIAGITAYSFTPRWDHKWFGVFVPLTVDGLKNFNYGLTARLGPIVIGTRNLKPIFKAGSTYGVDFFALVKVPIPHGKPKKKAETFIF